MKLSEIIRTANHNLLRNKTRTILTILAIFIGSFAIITTTAIQTAVNDFIDSQVESFGGEGFIQMYGKGVESSVMASSGMAIGAPAEYTEGDIDDFGRPAITKDQIEKVKKTKGIKGDSVLVGKFGSTTYVESTKNGKKFTASLNILTNDSVHSDLLAGQIPDNSSKEYQVLLPSEDWAKSLGYDSAEDAVGQTTIFVWSDPVTKKLIKFNAKISGVEAPSVITGGSLRINSALNDKLYEENTKYLPAVEKEKVYTLAAEYDYENYSAEEIKDALDEIGLDALTLQDIIGQIKDFFDVIISIFTAFGYVALLAASIGIINTLLMSVQERTREIGLMKSFGMSNFKVFLSFAFEAIMLGFWGSALGAIASMVVCNFINAGAHATDGFLIAFPTFNLVKYTPETVIPVIVLIMLISFFAGVLPARKASKKDPIESLRYE